MPATDAFPQRDPLDASAALATLHPALATESAEETARQVIEAAHQRSQRFGLESSRTPDASPLARAEMDQTLEKSRVLRVHAAPVMESLYENIINTHSMVVLTDAMGTILHTLGDGDFVERAQRVALQPGVSWAEQNRGTNAIGTAIAEAAPTTVHADQHFLRANHFLTCSATPIFDPRGEVAGILDVTGDFRNFHKHTMALVRMSARIIENQLFDNAFQKAICIHFHSRPEFIGTLMEGIIACDQEGRVLAANRGALFLTGLGKGALETHTFSSLFGMPLNDLREHYRTVNPTPLTARLLNGMIVGLRADLRTNQRWITPGFAASQAPVTPAATDHAGPPPINDGGAAASLFNPPGGHQDERHAGRSNRLSSLRYLNTGDPQMQAVIAKAQKVIGRDIPIMVIGETGTGKELLAQAIHNDSPRARMPFIAVNCASLPDTLIESELFGYEDGAFTGARKRGSHGKIVAANGGTLFLDEIGDMPLQLQARLLRVLQERVVTPLGSNKSIPVNVMIICATNRNLRDMIARAEFREDLYYRLNGLVVKLPPLRDRTDLGAIVSKILLNEAAHGARYTVAPEVLDAFHRSRWPGNFRQLTNVIRTAIVMADGDQVIRMDHMPDDFIEELEQPMPEGMTPRAAPPSATPAHGLAPGLTDFAAFVPPNAPGMVGPTSDLGGGRFAPGAGLPPQPAAMPAGLADVMPRGDNGFAPPRPDHGAAPYAGNGAHPGGAPFPGAGSFPGERAQPGGWPAQPGWPAAGADMAAAGNAAAATPGNPTAGAQPRPGEPGWPVGRSLDQIELELIRRALETHRGNVSAAARALGISRNTIYRKFPELGQRTTDAG
ncbi:sigma-54-dependent Fis family transcriptional regulator [Derxia gummosa]|uniref:Sigma-54-dependent Fis family transcriptional regulator n=1 Tax=Derxia gummosa DSM 723 TaxID=1121388 RepID=A0A9U5C5D7_9BURK|nr:sigma-54-dependent Fis family transcriptional regulator [Derxia gummosa]